MYQCAEQEMFNEYIGLYFTYGIKDENEHLIISDVSTDGEEVKGIVSLLNTYKVELIHVKDIVEDMISG